MKLNFLFVLCSVFIYGKISCVNAEETKNVDVSSDVDASNGRMCDDMPPCVVQYLKSKGKLANTFPSEKASAKCRFIMIEVFSAVRDIIKDTIIEVSPNDADCFMIEYDKTQTVDTYLTLTMIRKADSLTETQKNSLMISPLNELDEQFKSIITQCGVDKKYKFLSIFGKGVETETKLATSETASKTASEGA